MRCKWFAYGPADVIISCFIKIQTGLAFLVPAYPGCHGKEASVCLMYCCCHNTMAVLRIISNSWHVFIRQLSWRSTRSDVRLLDCYIFKKDVETVLYITDNTEKYGEIDASEPIESKGTLSCYLAVFPAYWQPNLVIVLCSYWRLVFCCSWHCWVVCLLSAYEPVTGVICGSCRQLAIIIIFWFAAKWPLFS